MVQSKLTVTEKVKMKGSYEMWPAEGAVMIDYTALKSYINIVVK